MGSLYRKVLVFGDVAKYVRSRITAIARDNLLNLATESARAHSPPAQSIAV